MPVIMKLTSARYSAGRNRSSTVAAVETDVDGPAGATNINWGPITDYYSVASNKGRTSFFLSPDLLDRYLSLRPRFLDLFGDAASGGSTDDPGDSAEGYQTGYIKGHLPACDPCRSDRCVQYAVKTRCAAHGLEPGVNGGIMQCAVMRDGRRQCHLRCLGGKAVGTKSTGTPFSVKNCQ